jgi:hypothetical protein
MLLKIVNKTKKFYKIGLLELFIGWMYIYLRKLIGIGNFRVY